MVLKKEESTATQIAGVTAPHALAFLTPEGRRGPRASVPEGVAAKRASLPRGPGLGLRGGETLPEGG